MSLTSFVAYHFHDYGPLDLLEMIDEGLSREKVEGMGGCSYLARKNDYGPLDLLEMIDEGLLREKVGGRPGCSYLARKNK